MVTNNINNNTGDDNSNIPMDSSYFSNNDSQMNFDFFDQYDNDDDDDLLAEALKIAEKAEKWLQTV